MNKNITKHTASFIEALEEILKAEDSILIGFNSLYGEGTGAGSGEDFYKRSGLSELLEEIKDAVKAQIGESMEIALGESLYKNL